ncbi:5-oxoprolinase subunit PxpB [Limosilactobacillus alvi]|uniref:5-oxoprolinase subunit PxpB n=1 Tax=Limosilactobacillus alvi TaxID=990412 RepID=UPI0030844838
MDYQLFDYGDQAIVIELGKVIDPEINRRVQLLGQLIMKAKIPAIETIIPAYATLTVTFNGQITNGKMLRQRLVPIIESSLSGDLPVAKTWLIPVAYGGEYGPDLRDVADYGGITPTEVIRLHTAQKYLIYFLGFLPGFAYMGTVPDQIAMPRLASPRLKIPAGSIGIAGQQTGFYPVTSPGGWRIIGQTPLKLYQPENPVSFYQAGDQIQFEAVTPAEFKAIQLTVQAKTYQPREAE